MTELNEFFLAANNIVWSYIVVGLCFLAGIYCSIRFAFIQFRCFPHALSLLRGSYETRDKSDGITTFQALATALSSTTGIGNIAGVAVAIKLGGPGAIFWMWMMALLGMALKYAEATLGSIYRTEIGRGHEMGGGPMYYITAALGPRWQPVATFYAVCTAIACLGAWNMFQSNQAAATLYDQFAVPTWLTGTVLSVFAALVLVGGIQRIGQVASKLVPFMCLIYVSTVLVICLTHYELIPAVFSLIVSEAFRFDSAGGGILGTAILIGIRRAVFSNEAGTGSAAIAHAAAHTDHPVRQGIAASLGPFIDTVIVCAATAFVILLAGFYGNESYQNAGGKVHSFEMQYQSDSGAWMHTSSNVPNSKTALQSFTEGDMVLAHSSSLTEHSPFIALAPLLTAHYDALRFTAWTAEDRLRVKLINGHGDLLVEFPVSSGHHQQNGSFGTITMSGQGSPGQWQSWILSMDQKAREASRTGSWKLQFVAGGEAYIDRLEAVNNVNGIVLSSAAFAQFFGFFGTIFIPIAALFFAYTTILAGNYYGEVACHYLNENLVKPYLWIYIAAIFVGCVVNLDIVMNFSDLTLGVMTIPNIIAIVLLTPVVTRETKVYFQKLRNGEMQP